MSAETIIIPIHGVKHLQNDYAYFMTSCQKMKKTAIIFESMASFPLVYSDKNYAKILNICSKNRCLNLAMRYENTFDAKKTILVLVL